MCHRALLLSAATLVAVCHAPLAARAAPEPELTNVRAWTNQAAVPLKIEALPNGFKVTDTLYRGAQPAPEGFKEIKKLGIKTVVGLRAFHSDGDAIRDAGLQYEHISFKTWHAEEEDVVRFLRIVTDTNKTPVFVHCHYGADRTGTMVAIYRLTVCGWNKQDAIDEMVNGGFGFHKTWGNLITFIKDLDIAAIKKKAGLAVKR